MNEYMIRWLYANHFSALSYKRDLQTMYTDGDALYTLRYHDDEVLFQDFIYDLNRK